MFGSRQSISRAIFATFFSAAVSIASPASADPFYDMTLRGASRPTRSASFARSRLGKPRSASAFKVSVPLVGLRDEPIAVSGVVVVPAGPAPAGGRPVVAWAHPTTGVARHCAPSLVPEVLSWIPGLDAMLARGFVVAATDYPGLGTVGPHPYLIGRSEGRAVLELGASGARTTGVRGRHTFRHLGALAGRTCGALRGRARPQLRARAPSRWCRRGSTCHGARRVVPRGYPRHRGQGARSVRTLVVVRTSSIFRSTM